jgi:hypothetical protein
LARTATPTHARSTMRILRGRPVRADGHLFGPPTPRLRMLTTVVVACTLAGLQLGHLTSAEAGTGLTNASFESGWTSSTAATCWKLGGAGSGSATLAASKNAHSGAWAAKLTATTLASGSSRNVIVDQGSSSCAPTVVAGHSYTLSAWYQASARIRMVVYYRDGAGTWHWFAQSPRSGRSATWRAMTYRTAAMPAGSTALSFGLSLASAGSLLVDDAAFADTTAVADTPTATPSGSVVNVSNASQLSAALSHALPGQTIALADGTYTGHFALTRSGTSAAPVRITGSRGARLDGGSVSSGYVLHLDNASYVQVDGITITNGQKALVLDQSSHNVLTNLDVHTAGNELVLLRNFSRDNVVYRNEIHDSGHIAAGYGEGIYIGLAKSNWSAPQSRTLGGPDTSDRNQVISNHVYNTTAENLDIKEGTTGGLIAGNRFDSTGMTGANYADSWVDVKGNSYVLRANSGVNPTGTLLDGYQTHVALSGWGNNNIFEANTSAVNAPGYAIRIQTSGSGNLVRASNTQTGAAEGLTNITVTP